jgi:hypothetical protein
MLHQVHPVRVRVMLLAYELNPRTTGSEFDMRPTVLHGCAYQHNPRDNKNSNLENADDDDDNNNSNNNNNNNNNNNTATTTNQDNNLANKQ